MIFFSYNFPHRKTQDFLLYCAINNININMIIAQERVQLNHEKIPFKFKNEVKPIFHPKELADFFNIDYKVLDHNSQESEDLLNTLRPELGLITGARILKKEIINKFKIGIINFHPGDIPIIRGLYSPLKAIKLNHKQILTSHLINEKIDAGKILIKKEIEIQQSITISEIYEKLYQAQFEIISTSIKKALKSEFQIINNFDKYDNSIPYSSHEAFLKDLKKYNP